LAKLPGVAWQIIQIVLALPIVAAFALVPFGFVRPDHLSYLLTNLVSSAGLAVMAVLSFQLGFVITNVLWVAVSAAGLRNLARTRRVSSRPARVSD
jgi:hypothetical protein